MRSCGWKLNDPSSILLGYCNKELMFFIHPTNCLMVGVGVFCFHIHLSVLFWFLLFILLNHYSNLFMFCKNVDNIIRFCCYTKIRA